MDKEKLFYEKNMNPLDYMDLSYYINTKESFKLKHIIEWCCNHLESQVASVILQFINDNSLNDMESEYMINHISFRDFAERDKAEEYQKYLGYDMYKV